MAVWIYKLVSLKNGNCYVGATSCPEKRMEAHAARLRNPRRRWGRIDANDDFRRAFPKHTEADVEMVLLEKLDHLDDAGCKEANAAEARHILAEKAFNSPRRLQIEVIDRTATATA